MAKLAARFSKRRMILTHWQDRLSGIGAILRSNTRVSKVRHCIVILLKRKVGKVNAKRHVRQKVVTAIQ